MRPLDPRLLRLSRSARGFIAAAVATGVLRTGATVLVAWGIATAITDTIDAPRGVDVLARITPTLAVLAGAFVVRAVAAWATDDLAARAAARVKGELRRAVLDRAAERGPGWLAERSSAGFATTLGPGLDALDAYFGRYVPQLVLTAVATPVLLVAIGARDLKSGIVILCALPVIPVFMILIGFATQALQRRQEHALARLGGAFLEAVEGLSTLKAFGRARRQVRRIGAVTDEYRRGTLGVLRLSFVSGFALELAASLSVALVAVSIGVRLIDADLGLGAALFVLVLAPEAFAPIRQVGADFHAAADGVDAAGVVLDVLADDPVVPARPGADAGRVDRASAVASTGVDALVLDGVTIDRPDGAIGPVSARFTPGTVVAVTGPSGSGKTTLLAAVRGAVPSRGAVLIPAGASTHGSPDGLAGRPAPASVTWMDQRPRLVRGTIAENVAMTASPDAEALVAAMRAAGLDLDPALGLGAGGSGVSGGQAQRIAFARAVYRVTVAHTPVVLLDEPTSALDAEAEAVVVASIRRLAATGAVVLVASHRPAVVAAADARLEIGDRAVRQALRSEASA